MKLYIFGNGFDVAHGLKTSYTNFKEFVENEDEYIYGILNEAEIKYNLNKSIDQQESVEWNRFEENLKFINYNSQLNELSFRNKNKEEVKENMYILKSNIDSIGTRINNLFQNWINNLKIEVTRYNEDLLKEKNAYFLNFNYTQTLEEVYNLKEVNHIHISNNSGNNKYIFGHKEEKKNETDRRFVSPLKLYDETKIFIKPVYDLIKLGRIEEYKNITKIYFWGFSLSEVDMPYIKKILIENKTTIQSIYLCKYQYDKKDDYENYNNFLKSNGIAKEIECFDDSIKV
ncbi:AbiH family protein [Staphylococcus argenteus]|uniref:AbiH family protein n=1 Tax=Staphylococcus argenteus TaxID=985002 RepID=UPI001FBA7C4D|nr:AbiH family protein [Staphylococcus argenteus]GJF55835.1 hypothetical protein SA19088_25780 [Staphylococcus argenteus]GJF94516.1 hypothetical protein SASC210_26000 [Staphylococcus argenteus]GJF97175.1 hypothetical protein SASC252_26340 [Staphylococcus argenteus]GJF99815.1 hypothetical protein SASC253_26130 [Staphylococcus argenteus]GJG02480.1 hypothetical protein SASC254_26420 [Staphylococcus argenteus]